MLQSFRLPDRVPKGCVSASSAGLQTWTRSPRPSGGAGSDGCPVIGLQGLDKRLDTAPSSWPRPAAESTTETVLINEANRLTGYVSINRISYGLSCIKSVNVSEVCIKNCGLPRISPLPLRKSATASICRPYQRAHGPGHHHPPRAVHCRPCDSSRAAASERCRRRPQRQRR